MVTGSRHGPLIDARCLAKGFGGHEVLRDVSFQLDVGQVVALRGENGSGKTTLLNILSGNLAPDAGELRMSINDTHDRFRWPVRWWRQLDPFDHFKPERMARAGIGRVWQDTRLFGTFSVLDNVTIASPNRVGESPLSALLLRRSVDRLEAANRARAAEHLTHFGLGGRLESSCDMLSLGQTKRAAIARVVQAGARVILLDEPLAGLDDAGQADVLRHLQELAESAEFTIVVVEHVINLPKVLALATDVWTLRDGRIDCRRAGSVEREVAARPTEWPSASEAPGEDVPDGGGPPALEVEGLTARRGYRRVLEDFSLRTEGRRVRVFVRPNAWGKTTLFDAIAGLIPTEAGRILVHGKEVSGMRSWERARSGVSYLRSADNVVPGLTVAEHLALARGRETLASKYAEWRALLPPMHKRAALLSGGEKQRLALGCLPLGAVLLLDEPLLNLDEAAIDVLLTLLGKLDRATLIAVPSADGGNGRLRSLET